MPFIKTSTAVAALLLLTACDNDASVASRNIAQAADNFEIARRVVFYNGITDQYLLSIEGYCSLDINTPKALKVTCKTGPGAFKKHYLGLSDNVTYFAEQLEPAAASTSRYRVVFKPLVIIPDIRVQ